MNDKNKLIINIFKCPICKNNHETNSKYSRTVCHKCINNFGTTNKKGNKLEIILDDTSSFFTKVEHCYSKNKECYINGYPCYIILSENLDTYEIVCTLYIPNSHNKSILRNNYIDNKHISFKKNININNLESKSKSLLFSFVF
jgi:hypothetical protein